MVTRGIKHLQTKTQITELILKSTEREFGISRKTIYATGASFCAKQSALHLAAVDGVVGDVSSASSFYFAIGEAVHEIIDNALKPISVGTELTVRHPYGVNGRIDNLVFVDGDFKIVDTKTCGENLPKEIRQSHKAQLLTYALISGIRNASILYVSRNVAGWDGKVKIKEISADFTDQEIWDGAVTMAESVYAGRKKYIPDFPQPQHKTIKSCGFCPFIDHCHRGKELGFETKDDWLLIGDWDTDDAREIDIMARELVDNMPNRRAMTLADCLLIGGSNPLARQLEAKGDLV